MPSERQRPNGKSSWPARSARNGWKSASRMDLGLLLVPLALQLFQPFRALLAVQEDLPCGVCLSRRARRSFKQGRTRGHTKVGEGDGGQGHCHLQEGLILFSSRTVPLLTCMSFLRCLYRQDAGPTDPDSLKRRVFDRVCAGRRPATTLAMHPHGPIPPLAIPATASFKG